jgi:hypothetical protein
MTWVIQATDDDDGFWSNELGWTSFPSATRFTQQERERLSLPTDSKWIEERIVQQNFAIEILQKSHDGNDLTIQELRLVELAANGKLNKIGVEALEELRTKVSETA